MKYTNNLRLVKPDPTEKYDIEVFNINSDLIDNEFGSVEGSIGDLNNDVSGINGRLNTVDSSIEIINESLQGIGNRLDSLDGSVEGLGNRLDSVDSSITQLESNVVTVSNVNVPASSFVADTTYEDYPFKADITVTGVTANHVPNVYFGVSEAISGVFAPVASSGANTVTIYATEIPSTAIVIPSIQSIKGGGQA